LKDRNDYGEFQQSYFLFIGNKKAFICFVHLQRLSLDNVMIPLYGIERLYPAHATMRLSFFWDVQPTDCGLCSTYLPLRCGWATAIKIADFRCSFSRLYRQKMWVNPHSPYYDETTYKGFTILFPKKLGRHKIMMTWNIWQEN